MIFAYTIKAWRLATQGHPGNHSALLTASSGSSSPGELGRRPGRSVGDVRAGHAGGRAVPRDGRAARPARGHARTDPPAVPAHARSRARRPGVDPAGVRALLRRPRPRRPRGRGARGDGQPGRRVVHQPRRLDQPGRRLAPRRPDRLVRRRHRHARALARDRARPAHRARDRRGQPRRAARRARGDLVARRPAAAADRHPVRPVRQPRARAVVVRHVRRARSRS